MKLAIKGGKPYRTKLFDAHNTIGQEELDAVTSVIQSGVLSQYVGAWHKDFYGGPQVQNFEKEWASKSKASYAISVNSNTSGLLVACGAVGIQPGDEVIVSPFSICASATVPIFWGGIPVFADINKETLSMDPKSIEKCISPKTKAIIVVHLMGYPADMDPIIQLAKKYNLKIIEDCAQVPFGKYKGRPLGTIGDLGVFSLNYHKHIHTGEGGVIVTNDEELNTRCQLIRNHGEAVVEGMGYTHIQNIIGLNLRLGELEAAIGRSQIKKFDQLMETRNANAIYLMKALNSFDCLKVPEIPMDCPFNCNCRQKETCTHSYYFQSMTYDSTKNHGIHRDVFVKAIEAELPSSKERPDIPLISGGYVKPLYYLPIFQQKAFDFRGLSKDNYDYSPGVCPHAETLHFESLIIHEFLRPSMSMEDMKDVVGAFSKVIENAEELLK